MTSTLKHRIEKRLREHWAPETEQLGADTLVAIIEDIFTEADIMEVAVDEYDAYMGVDFKADIERLEEANSDLEDKVSNLENQRDELAEEVDSLKAQLEDKED